MRIQHPQKKLGKKIVVIVGAGFAGLNAAKALSAHQDIYVILLDQRNHHLFQPLLYQVATAGLNTSEIAVPIRAQFSNVKNVEVHLAKVDEVDLHQKIIKSHKIAQEFEFDFLILACGAQHSYFGHNEWEEFAPGLKTLEQAIEIRRRILSAFELAETETDEAKQKALLTFVVVGGGPTGVELAGAIADISRTVLVNDFKRIDPSQANVILLEAGPRLLTAFADALSESTRQALTDLGVQVRTKSMVEVINADGVIAGGEFIPAKCVFWAAGVQANQVAMSPSVPSDRSGRILVQPDLSIAQFPDIFVIGDMCALEIKPGKFVPGLAPAAIQEGQHVAKVIAATLKNEARPIFKYLDKGQMATIGKNKAVIQFKNIKISGYIAWVGWLFIHVFYLIGFKNKISVFLQWTWSYLFSKRGTRLITGRNWRTEASS